MEDWLIALIIILVVHYFCAIFTIWLLLKDKLVAGRRIRKAPLVLWNLLVLFVPILGPAIYLICHFAQKRGRGAAQASVSADPSSATQAEADAQSGIPADAAPYTEEGGGETQKNNEN